MALDERAFADYAGHGPLNTDDRPYISFTDRRRRDTGAGLPALSSLLSHLVVEVNESLFDVDEEEKQSIERRLRSRKYSIEGAVSLLNDKTGEAVWHYRQARKTDPGRENGPAGFEKVRTLANNQLIVGLNFPSLIMLGTWAGKVSTSYFSRKALTNST